MLQPGNCPYHLLCKICYDSKERQNEMALNCENCSKCYFPHPTSTKKRKKCAYCNKSAKVIAQNAKIIALAQAVSIL